MKQDVSATQQKDPLDSSMYRMAHLHGGEWVMLKPQDAHSPTENDPTGMWAGGRIFKCETCEETVVIAPVL